MKNIHIVAGRLGKDAETRQVGENTVTSFSVATDDNYKDKNGNWVENTDWINITVWNPSQTVKSLSKGDLIIAEGKVKTRQYEDANGVKKYSTSTVCKSVRKLNKDEEAAF